MVFYQYALGLLKFVEVKRLKSLEAAWNLMSQIEGSGKRRATNGPERGQVWSTNHPVPTVGLWPEGRPGQRIFLLHQSRWSGLWFPCRFSGSWDHGEQSPSIFLVLLGKVRPRPHSPQKAPPLVPSPEFVLLTHTSIYQELTDVP